MRSLKRCHCANAIMNANHFKLYPPQYCQEPIYIATSAQSDATSATTKITERGPRTDSLTTDGIVETRDASEVVKMWPSYLSIYPIETSSR